MRERTADEYANGLEGLLFDIERMEVLIGRMLTLTRLSEMPLSGTETADVGHAAELLASRLRPLAEARTVSVFVHANRACEAKIALDDAEILCSNLLMNAVQHSPEGGTVEVSVAVSDDAVVLQVQDGGPGIPPEALPHVFERFYRADASRSRRSGGAGLGLALCKAIVDRCAGEIVLRSEPGLGTTVRVTLPAARAQVFSVA
jgi:signal transduction histidine kinase